MLRVEPVVGSFARSSLEIAESCHRIPAWGEGRWGAVDGSA
jgi:hypothetical protein